MTPFEAWNGHKPTVEHIRKWGCKVYRHINKETGRKKWHKKSMTGFLVGYEMGGFYRIYHPVSKEVKVSRDVVFDETQFFNMREVKGETSTIAVPDEIMVDEMEEMETSFDGSHAPTIHEKIDTPPTPPTPSPTNATPPVSPKPPNRRSRCLIARAFKATLKWNWKSPRNHKEAMEADDAEQ
jgi:hypothetical protein